MEAMQIEIKALKNNHTWKVIDLSKGKAVIGSKWVYKIKYKENKDVERFK